MWVEPDSTVERLIFRFSDELYGDEPVPIYVMRVDSCKTLGIIDPALKPPPIWIISTDDEASAEVNKIEFGVAPAGWRTTAGPTPLTPGCYLAGAGAGTRLAFSVGPDGSIVEITEEEAKTMATSSQRS